MAKYHDPDDELTRTPIDKSFERLELPLEMWKDRIIQEVSTLEYIQDGSEPSISVLLPFPGADALADNDPLSPTTVQQAVGMIMGRDY